MKYLTMLMHIIFFVSCGQKTEVNTTGKINVSSPETQSSISPSIKQEVNQVLKEEISKDHQITAQDALELKNAGHISQAEYEQLIAFLQ